MNYTDNTTWSDLHTERGFCWHDVFLVSLQLLSMMFIVMAMTALSRTCKLPKTVKFQTVGLLVFDFLAVGSTVALVQVEPQSKESAILEQLTGIFIILSHLTVTLMSLDRLVALQWPNIYLRLFDYRRLWKVSLTIWLLLIFICSLRGFSICFQLYVVNENITSCGVVTIGTLVFLLFLVVIVPCCCYIHIYRIILKQSKALRIRPVSLFRYYRSTSIVLLYMLNIVLTNTVYCVCLFLGKSLSNEHLSKGFAFVLIFNALFDTCSYVLWFQECRLELLKIFAQCLPKLRHKVEPMRLKVFDIWTIHNGRQSPQGNRIEDRGGTHKNGPSGAEIAVVGLFHSSRNNDIIKITQNRCEDRGKESSSHGGDENRQRHLPEVSN